ncbi:MAG TPA: hypothetical protein PK323_13000 [Bacteroidia bacterium]|nr:hypothetical protein [Bacteroidia bacterium]
MKTVKLLIATALVSTSFYACKKEEINIKAKSTTYQNQNSNNLEQAAAVGMANGMIKIVFDNIGNMVIEGNPNLDKLITMYNASSTAIQAAQEVFNINPQEKLSILFDRDGNTIASDIPAVPVGTNIDAFISNFCKIKPTSAMTIKVTKSALTKNHEEFWNALPEGANQKFTEHVALLQQELPLGYSLQVSLSENESPNIIYLDENGNPQPVQNPNSNCISTGSGFVTYLKCIVDGGSWFF